MQKKVIHIKKKPAKAAPPPKPKRHIVINKPNADPPKEPPPPKPKRHIVINKPNADPPKEPPPPKPKRHIVINKPNAASPKETPPPKPKRHIVINKPGEEKEEESGNEQTKLQEIIPIKGPPVTISRHEPSAMKDALKNRRPVGVSSGSIHKRKHKPDPVAKGFVIGGIVIAVIIAVAVVSQFTIKPQQRRRYAAYKEENSALTPRELAMAAMTDARIFEKENAGKFDELIAVFQKIVDDYPDTSPANTAARVVVRYTNMKRQAVGLCILKLEGEGELLLSQDKREEAIAHFRDYTGPYAAETEEVRLAHVAEIEKEDLKKEQEKSVGILEKAFAKLFDGGVSDTYLFMKLHENDAASLAEKDQWQQLRDILDSSMKVPERVLASFKKQIGQIIEVELKSGKMEIQISSVKNGKIQHYKRIGRANIIKEISIDDLSDKEWTKRLGKDLNGFALSKALEAVDQNKYNVAVSYLPLIPSPLQESLTVTIKKLQMAHRDKLVTTQLAIGLRMSGVKISSAENFKANLALLKKTELSPGMRLMLYSVARDIWVQSRKTDWIKRPDVVALIKYIIELKPTDEDWAPPPPEADADNTSETDESENGSDTADDSGVKKQQKDKSEIDWRTEIDF